MYRLTKHERTLRSAEEIGQGLLICLQKKTMRDISISDIHRATGVSRSTFYRLFDTPDDVLLYLCDQYKKGLIDAIVTQKFADLKELFMFPLNYSLQNFVLLDALISNHRIDLLNDLYSVACRPILELMAPYRQSDDVTNSYVTTQIYSSFTALFSTWMLRGRQETPQQLAEYIKEFSRVIEAIVKQF